MVREAPEAHGQAPAQPAQGLVRQRRGHRGARPPDGGLPSQAPAAVLLLMLASGESPVYPAHVPLADQRSRCVGTGPFKFKEWRRGEFVEYVQEPRLLREGPAVPRRAPVRHRQRARDAHRRAPGRTAGHRGARRDDQEHRRPAQGGRPADGHHASGIADLAEPPREPHAAAVQRRAGAARGGPAPSTATAILKGVLQGAGVSGRRPRAPAVRLVGPGRDRS